MQVRRRKWRGDSEWEDLAAAAFSALFSGFLSSTALRIATLPFVLLARLFVEATVFHFLEDAFAGHHALELRDCSRNIVSVHTYLDGSEYDLVILFVHSISGAFAVYPHPRT